MPMKEMATGLHAHYIIALNIGNTSSTTHPHNYHQPENFWGNQLSGSLTVAINLQLS